MIILFISGRSVMRLRRVHFILKIRDAIAKSSFYFVKDQDAIEKCSLNDRSIIQSDHV